jgi:hypothetical protein
MSDSVRQWQCNPETEVTIFRFGSAGGRRATLRTFVDGPHVVKEIKRGLDETKRNEPHKSQCFDAVAVAQRNCCG